MAIKINTSLNLAGIPIAPGSVGLIMYVSPFTSFTKDGENYIPNYDSEFALRIFKNLEAYKNNQHDYIKQPIAELPFKGIMKLTKQEAVSLTTTIVEQKIKEWCESYLGFGTCEIIDIFP